MPVLPWSYCKQPPVPAAGQSRTQRRMCPIHAHALWNAPALTTKLMPLRIKVISSTGTLPPVSFTNRAANAKISAAHKTQKTPEDQTVLHARNTYRDGWVTIVPSVRHVKGPADRILLLLLLLLRNTNCNQQLQRKQVHCKPLLRKPYGQRCLA